MDELAAAVAKLAGIVKAVKQLLSDTNFKEQRPLTSFDPAKVQHYFDGAEQQLEQLRRVRSDLFGDFQALKVQPERKMAALSSDGSHIFFFSREQLETLKRDIEQIFEVRANSELVTNQSAVKPMRTVFISHGRAPEWREVQQYIEKDIKLATRELAQEPNLGRTVLEKLHAIAGECDSAVIVMTGDDLASDGTPRARENVIHEIGYFQGRYGLSRVCLMHEDGVSIPSNVHGLVYSPFPKGMVSAAFGLLVRELNAMYLR